MLLPDPPSTNLYCLKSTWNWVVCVLCVCVCVCVCTCLSVCGGNETGHKEMRWGQPNDHIILEVDFRFWDAKCMVYIPLVCVHVWVCVLATSKHLCGFSICDFFEVSVNCSLAPAQNTMKVFWGGEKKPKLLLQQTNISEQRPSTLDSLSSTQRWAASDILCSVSTAITSSCHVKLIDTECWRGGSQYTTVEAPAGTFGKLPAPP